MQKINTILFDLDGTLTDPGEGITNSVAYALSKYKISVQDRRELYAFIGPPLTDSFIRYYGFSEEEAENAVEVYREYFRDRGIFENTLYPGIKEMLSELNQKGKKLVLATSKPEIFAKQILDHFALTDYFTYVAGSTLDHSRTNKHDVIEYALSACEICDRRDIIMVGDREHDIIGAKKSGLPSVGVLYGYGNREELTNAGADYLAADVTGLHKLLLSLG